MRILCLAPQPFFQYRGTPIAVKDVAAVLGTSGHHVDLLAFHEGEDIDLPNCRIFRTRKIPMIPPVPPGFSLGKVLYDLLLLFKACRLMRCTRYDVIHAVEESVFIAMLLGRLTKTPFVYDMDSSLPRQLTDKYRILRPLRRVLEWLEGQAIQRSHGVLAVCKSLEEAARHYDRNKLIVRLEDRSLLADGSSGSEDVRSRLDITGPIIMYVGNLESYQGIDLLLKSHSRVLEKVPQAELVLIGGRANDSDRYVRVADEMGIAARTHFLGPRPICELGHFLQQADVLVSPRCQGNNTPMKIYSYLDSGKPLVATRLPTHLQALDEEVAWLADPIPEAFAEGIVTLLGDPELGELMAFRAKQRADALYSPEVFSQKLTSFYRHLEAAVQPPTKVPQLAPGPATQAVEESSASVTEISG